jgi:hypothetical protein
MAPIKKKHKTGCAESPDAVIIENVFMDDCGKQEPIFTTFRERADSPAF